MYFDQQRLDQAVASADSLISLYPDSYYLPFGLKLKADVFLLSAHTKDQALVIYHTLLEQYGFYPFAAEIRDIIRREAPGGRS
jgi:outer membrane protein assembly factor BamD (BamD/ComL family)